MSPLIGIYASEMSANLWEPQGAYDSLASVTLSTATASVVFAGIPSGYQHLQLRTSTATSAANGSVVMQFNGDTGSNYSGHYLLGNGSAASAGASINRTNMYFASTTSGANILVAGICDILNYSNININKTIRCLEGFDVNGTGGEILLMSGNWRNTAAVSSITIFESAGANFTANSSFALYGVK